MRWLLEETNEVRRVGYLEYFVDKADDRKIIRCWLFRGRSEGEYPVVRVMESEE